MANIAEIIDKLKVVGEGEKQRVIDAYLEEVSREEEILYNIEYYLKRIGENLLYLDDAEEIKMLVDQIKTKIEYIKQTHNEKLEV